MRMISKFSKAKTTVIIYTFTCRTCRTGRRERKRENDRASKISKCITSVQVEDITI
jgi:hypothetical protein